MNSNWQTKKLGEISTIFNGNSINERIKKEKYTKINNGFPFIATKDVDFETHSIEYNNGVKIPFGEKSFKIAHSNSVLICAEGGSAGKKIAFNEKNICFGNKLFATETKNEINSKFVYYWYLTPSFFDAFKNQMNGIIGGVSIGNFKNLLISFPLLSEQQRIVKILDEAFEKINKVKSIAEKNLQNSKDVFELYLETVFTGSSNNWSKKKLSELCFLITKGSSPKWQGINYVDKPGILFVTSENVGEGQLILNNKKFVEEKFNKKDRKSILQKGDVLTNIVGASIGRTAIYSLDNNANINQAVCILRCNTKFLLNEYLMNLLNSPFFKKILHSNEVNTARANLSLGFFSNLSIPLPSITEQRNIITKINCLSIQIKKLESIYKQKLADLEEFKKSVLNKAFNGEL